VSTTPVVSSAHQAELDSARKRTDQLFEIIKPEALYSRPVPERHRLIFYLGHLEAFDWNQICRQALDLPSFHPEFDKLFEFGIDPPVGKVAEDAPSDWPDVEQVRAYNSRVRTIIDDVLERAPQQILHVALEHRLMHAETLAYLSHNVPYEQKIPQRPNPAYSTRPTPANMLAIPGGVATLGQKLGEFGWDNEFEEHRVSVPPFSIGKFKVSNGQYLEFVKAGAKSPHFWVQRGDDWFCRGMFAEFPLPLNAPVYVTHEEATAYARWLGRSLPTEAQFHRAAFATFSGDEHPFPWGNAMPDSSRGNFDFHHWDPVDIDAHPRGDSAFGVSQLAGNGWEWTSTPFGPFPGFQPFSFYPGYSANFFDGQHYVLKGASPRTASCFLRRSFRNWFRPNYPHVYASFRLVEN
jgi:formylglycine-generating enzyme required for sulfatase activity